MLLSKIHAFTILIDVADGFQNFVLIYIHTKENWELLIQYVFAYIGNTQL